MFIAVQKVETNHTILVDKMCFYPLLNKLKTILKLLIHCHNNNLWLL